MLSRPCTYAIRALTYLAMQPPGKLTGSREISDSEGVPNSFLCKILLDLRRKRLLRSYKGTGGGYELALPPDKISLLMIVEAIEGEVSFSGCILEDKECSWLKLKNQLVSFLETQTLEGLVQTRHAQQKKGFGGRNQAPVQIKDQMTHLSVKPSI
jgi:Rrf2 family iron-sulfur cluster assembly transcriptional regulator